MFATREDPGTGSASSGLGCLLSAKDGMNSVSRFVFEQGVEMGRRNEISVEVHRGENHIEKVLLSGEAVKVMEGTLEV
jgi:PhzF family phenazine biosynthesis protein